MSGMDKVDFSITSMFNHPEGLKQQAKKTGSGDKPKGSHKIGFTEIMKGALDSSAELGQLREYAASEEALTELMDAVHSAGSDLLDRPFHDEILKYKRAVRDFIHYVVENSYEIEKSQSRRRGKVKIHVQIQVIDGKLEELAAAILSGQASQLQRVSKIDEIRGLLVDLTVAGTIRGSDG